MNVYVFMTDGFETVEALAVIDILRRAQIRTVTVSITGSHHITSSQNITVKADALYEDIDFDKISTDDMLFLPGGAGTANYYKDKALLDLLVKHAENGGWISADCGFWPAKRLSHSQGTRMNCWTHRSFAVRHAS